MSNPSDSPYALVADDDFLVRMDAETILEDAGFHALSAGNGNEAIKLLDEHAGSIVLLFTDVEMPGGPCLIPEFDGAFFTSEWRDALWARFFTAAPQRLRRSVERSSIVKRA